MSNQTKLKGRMIFIPEDGTDTYEIDLDSLFEDKKEKISLFSRLRSYLPKLRRNKTIKLELEEEEEIDLDVLVCQKLEELLSTAHWIPTGLFETYPGYVIDVYPSKHAEGWEVVVTLTMSNGSSVDITLAELLSNYIPQDSDLNKHNQNHNN
jgi:hypothetical protein